MSLRSYSGNAKRTALTGDITSGSMSFTVSDATGYPSPSGGEGPFVVALGLGLTGEEKVLVSSRSGNTFTVSERGFDGTTATAHGVGTTVDHTLSAADIRETNEHVFSTAADPHPDSDYLTTDAADLLYKPIGYTPTIPAKTYRIPHTFTISGEVKVDVAGESYIPPFPIPVPAGQAVDLASVRVRLNSGTSATCELRKNGTIVGAAFTVSSSTWATVARTTTFADLDDLALVITAVSGTPKGLSVAALLEYEV